MFSPRQTSSWISQILMKKYHVLSPMLKLQEVSVTFGRPIFTNPYCSSERVDPKAHKPNSSTWCSRKKNEQIGVERTRKGTISPQGFSIFAAGASKERGKFCAEEEEPVVSTNSVVERPPPEKPLSPEEWEKLKRKYRGYKIFEEYMLIQMINYNRPIDVAKSLLAAVAKRDGDIPYMFLLQYLVLCESQEQTKEICDIFDIMRARYKTFDSGAVTLLIRGLSCSPRWRDALTFLEQIKKQKVDTPSNKNYRDCINGALMNQEINLALELYHQLLAEGLTPTLDTLQLFFDTCKGVQDGRLKNELISMLNYLRDNQLYPEENFMKSIKQWFESIPGENWKGTITGIQRSGRCSSCNQTLEDINLSPEEYNLLKEKILKEVIQGKDVFRKTTPVELEEFQKFVNIHSPFDIVIDGLNVSKISPKYNPSDTLLDVVNYLAQKNPRLLVLGRKHMLKGNSQWKRQNMTIMSRKAKFFFTEDVSQDDPFLLYATLHSGNHCKFITHDLLRDHKACVSDELIQRLFFKWQRGHQMVIPFYKPGLRIQLQHVLTYNTIVQTTGNSWHIPYDDNFTKRTSYEVPTKWLCLQRK
ncbi:hypothetical protein JRQ81_000895 [Phrynocephalus forsythii]|uniref:Mitochondrial ribonuclease P catalytic subunit n=1 Tax=Phrynocephalus forsythii TaxID=171643 RepID=A0A9Q0Y645_9SAUR|nr:hypothetical protein JRQ81_000895 [Phrynocephalus forsythii]